jgi:hypothetical protein
VFLATNVLLVRWGALGVASARLVAYAVHAGWTFWFAAAFLRSHAPLRRGPHRTRSVAAGSV